MEFSFERVELEELDKNLSPAYQNILMAGLAEYMGEKDNIRSSEDISDQTQVLEEKGLALVKLINTFDKEIFFFMWNLPTRSSNDRQFGKIYRGSANAFREIIDAYGSKDASISSMLKMARDMQVENKRLITIALLQDNIMLSPKQMETFSQISDDDFPKIGGFLATVLSRASRIELFLKVERFIACFFLFDVYLSSDEFPGRFGSKESGYFHETIFKVLFGPHIPEKHLLQVLATLKISEDDFNKLNVQSLTLVQKKLLNLLQITE